MAIDVRCSPPTELGMGLFLNPPPKMRGYGDVYRDGWQDRMDEIVMPIPRFVQELDTAGVDRVVMIAADKETTIGSKVPNEHVADLVAQAPDRIIGFAAVDPNKGRIATEELEVAFRDLKMKGLTIGPWEHELYPDDTKYDPLYDLCIAHDVPVTIHASIHFGRYSKLDYSRPIHIDNVAVRFPDLKIIAVHGGWPWTAEMVAVAWRHPNVYIDISGVRPRYIAKAGTGWEPLLSYGDNILQDKVLWGTAWPLQPFARSLEETRGLPLKPHVMQKWIHDNAAALLGP